MTKGKYHQYVLETVIEMWHLEFPVPMFHPWDGTGASLKTLVIVALETHYY